MVNEPALGICDHRMTHESMECGDIVYLRTINLRSANTTVHAAMLMR